MMRSLWTSTVRLRWTALAVAALVALGGCRGDRDAAEDQGKRAAERIAIAKQFMADGRYTDAKITFEDVLNNVDPVNSEARFGKVLSELLQFSSIIRVVSQLAGDAAQADENEFLHELIDDLVSDLLERFDNLAFDLQRLKADPVFSFTLEQSTPVFLTDTDEPDLDLQGEWDRGEVFLLDVGVQAVLGILNLVQAIDLRADYLAIFNKVSEADLDLDFPDVDDDGETDVKEIVIGIEEQLPVLQNLIAYLLNGSPNFLDLDPGTGAAQMAKAGEHLANAVDSLRKALFFASKDIEFDADQSDDAIAYLGRGDGQLVAIDPDSDLCAARDSGDNTIIDQHTFVFALRFIVDEDGNRDEELESAPETGCFVTKLMDSLLPPGDVRIEDPQARINLVDDIVPLIEELLSDTSFGPLITPDVVRSILGNAVELDLGEFFYSGVAVRDLLPVWDTPAMQPDEDLRLLWMELECAFDPDADYVVAQREANFPEFATVAARQPYRVLDRIFCREDDDANAPAVPQVCDGNEALTCDLSHFSASNAALPESDPLYGSTEAPLANLGIGRLGADGVAGQFPYVAFREPSFGGVLYLDIYDLGRVIFGDDLPAELEALDDAQGFEEANLASLNAYLALFSQTQVGQLLLDFPEN